jgi:hypothetical protein
MGDAAASFLARTFQSNFEVSFDGELQMAIQSLRESLEATSISVYKGKCVITLDNNDPSQSISIPGHLTANREFTLEQKEALKSLLDKPDVDYIKIEYGEVRAKFKLNKKGRLIQK